MIGYQRRVDNHRPGGLVSACDEDVEMVSECKYKSRHLPVAQELKLATQPDNAEMIYQHLAIC